ncbi:MAG TPA: hypothetical protein VK698_20610 [Kofleriaceae bacterium]|nr:hypothetical protein [Kofleriaceae bacterium]
MKRPPPANSPGHPSGTEPRLRRRTLRQLTQVELGVVAAGRRQMTTTGVVNECNTVLTVDGG